MKRGSDLSATTPVSGAELIELFDEPAAVFDADGNLRLSNAAFSGVFAPISQFLTEGTSWQIFLSEAERKGVLPPETCNELRLIEENHLQEAKKAPTVSTSFADGSNMDIVMTSLSNGAFSLRLTVGWPSDEDDREIEQVMAKVLEACPTSLTMARIGDGQILYRSPAATELLGKGMNSHDHFVNREDRADFVTALLPDSRVDDMRMTGRKSDGAAFPASISARLIDYRGEDVVVYSILNLTDDIALQSELARQKDLTFRAEKMSALGELLAGVAHELNNPLSIVVGNMLILKEENLPNTVIGRVNKVSDAAERCVRIVRSFLAMARERPMVLTDAAPAILVDTAIDSYHADAQGTDVDVVSQVANDLPDLRVDETQIVQVLSNLLINAAQAIGETGVGDRVLVGTAISENPNYLRLTIEDNGPGVPDDIADKIFDPLFTTKSAGKGTGVGLALCNRIVASHGGTISLRRDVTEGACFVLDLPIA
ncbi:MAG: ATP-binding protein [Pseudomonadota bacterium]